MTTTSDLAASAPSPLPAAAADRPRDHRGSWMPTGAMIATRFMELRKRRGLMIALLVVNIGIPVVFLTVRLLAHAFAPKSYGPAGGYSIFTGLVAGVLFTFGFIVAATLGCTAGSVDLTEGMFRHMVVSGRSRLAIYLARIPAGLGIVVPMVAAGFAIVCAVCVFAAPTAITDTGVSVPAGLTLSGLEHWAAEHPKEVICNFSSNGPITVNVPCGFGPPPGAIVKRGPGTATQVPATQAQMKTAAIQIAKFNYGAYRKLFLYPPTSLMIRTGLWIELEAAIGLLVGLGLGSLLGQRTISVILMIVLELILTPLLARAHIAHLINAQRGIVGVAMIHLEPGGLPALFAGGGGVRNVTLLIPETRTVAVCVIVAWLVGWTAIGAWRMMTRDA